MIEVSEASRDDFDEVHDRLLVELDAKLPKERWRRLFEYPWRPADRPLGYVLRDSGRAVGYLSLVFRPDTGTGSPVCNLSSWVVLEPYRGSALRLLSPILARRDWTLVNLTPTPEVGPIFRGLGFSDLETHRRLILPDPSRMLGLAKGARLQEIQEGAGDVSQAEAQAVAHHRGLARFARVLKEGRSSMLGYRLGRLRGLPMAELLHVEDPALVSSALGPLQRWFTMKHGACMIATDARFLPGEPQRGTRVRELPAARLFRSPDRSAADISHLFTEMALLEL